MSRMSDLHLATAAERADDAKREAAWLREENINLRERIASSLEARAGELDRGIPEGYRGSSGSDYTFGMIRGLKDAATIVRNS